MRQQRKTSSHHESHTNTGAILWCVLGGREVMITDGSRHNVVTKKDQPVE